jgi:hypothetical protein
MQKKIYKETVNEEVEIRAQLKHYKKLCEVSLIFSYQICDLNYS